MAEHESQIANRLRSQRRTLAEFGLYAFRSTDLDDILQRATELVSQGLEIRLVKVLEVLPGGERMLLRAGVNWKPGVVGSLTFGAGHESPAGYALITGEPVVSRDVATETRFEIPEVLLEHNVRSMVNVPIAGEGSPFGVLEVDAPEKRDFDEGDVTFLWAYANLLAAAVDRHRTHQALEERARDQRMLIQELQHRVKNMLGLVHAIAQQTSVEGEGARAFQEALVGRLHALAGVEDLVFEDGAKEVDMRRLVERSVQPFGHDGQRVALHGPPLRLPARSGRIMALVLHELCTNATKYGALSERGGEVRVSWEIERTGGGDLVRFSWLESGGPVVTPPRRAGFGTRLLSKLVGYELDGEARLDHSPEGVRYRLEFPVTEE
jgi:two-component sensor histidine kinase